MINMRNLMVLLVITLMAVCFMSIACTDDAGSDNATDKTGADNADTQLLEKNTDAAAEGETKMGETDTVERTDEPVEDIEQNGVVSSTDGSQEGMVSNTTAGTEEGVTTRIEENGSVSIVDSTGNVIASRTADGVTESTTGTVDGVVTSGDEQTPTIAADEKKQEINSRGDVNIKNKIAIMKTNFGDLYMFFYDDKAPNHVRNFLYLAEKDFYKDVKFHRIKPDFMAQGGMARDDWGEPVPQLKLEVDPSLQAKHRRGALSAARTNDPNSATSQFFLVFSEEGAKHLDRQYTVYGQMFKGFDTLEKLEGIKVAPNPQMRGEVSRPLQDVYIVDVVVEDSAPYAEEIAKWKEENGL